ncbi:hypothetical protein K438DRAFT_1815736 [Mycena galopus ATCC 62051]|nr:hypothetical protein K438DRAFT_1815736 [Mycena galopus ATCC 62051]
MLLLKKRVNAYDGYNDKWEIIRMTHVVWARRRQSGMSCLRRWRIHGSCARM